MNRSILTLVAILVVLLVAYIIIDAIRDVSYQPKAFVKVDTTKVDAIGIHAKDSSILLKKVAGSWRLVEPVDYPAEARFAGDLLDKIGTLEVETLISEDSGKDSLFQVDTTGTEIVVLAGADTVAHFIVGKTADNYRHTYCRQVGEQKTYLVKGVFSSQLNRKAKEWRDKVILEMDKELISRIDFEYPREFFSLVKEDTVWNLEEKGKQTPADQKVVNRALSVLSQLRTFDFVDGDSARMVDFGEPELTVTINTDTGDIFRLVLVPQDKEKNRYLVRKKGVENTLFVIYKGSANSIMKKAKDFKEKVQTTS